MATKRTKNKSTVKRAAKKKKGVRVKVVGVGGAGCAVINRLAQNKIGQIEFIAINTDRQSLANTTACKKIRIGRKTTKGLGTGMNPVLGQQAAQESQKEIKQALQGADIIFFVAGLGGGTASGALPIILDTIKDLDILTIAVVTKPFTFEGSRKSMIADQSLNILNNKADTLIALSNENILYLIDRKTSLLDAFKSVDDILEHTISNITDIVNFSGLINLDLADLKTVLADAGRALLGIGEAEGEGRSVRAVRSAIDSPFFSLSFKGSKGIVFIMAGGDNLSIHEVNEAAKHVIGAVDSDCRVVFGVATNPAMGNKVRVTVIATGFSQNPMPHLESVSNNIPINVRESNRLSQPEPGAINITPEPSVKAGETFKDGQKIPEPTDELEIPSFLRKKKII